MNKLFIPIALMLACCAPVQIDYSKMPKNPQYCQHRSDCNVGEHCDFPAPNTYSVCLPGSHEIAPYETRSR